MLSIKKGKLTKAESLISEEFSGPLKTLHTTYGILVGTRYVLYCFLQTVLKITRQHIPSLFYETFFKNSHDMT